MSYTAKIEDLISQRDALRAKVDQMGYLLAVEKRLRKDADEDAGRYRWLRSNAASVGFCGVQWIWDQRGAKKQLDRAIDGAMADQRSAVG